MKSIKKYSVGLLGLIALLSVVFITSSPNSGVQGQAQTGPTPFGFAALQLRISDATEGAAVIHTVDFAGTVCEGLPLGGVVHSVDNDDFIRLGASGADEVLLRTHENTASGNAGAPTSRCRYTVTITSSQNCIIQIQTPANNTPGDMTDTIIARARAAGGGARTNSVTFSLMGSDVSAEDMFYANPGSTTRTLGGIAAATGRSGISLGRLTAVGDHEMGTDPMVTGGDVETSVNLVRGIQDSGERAAAVDMSNVVIEVLSTSCVTPTTGGIFNVNNAEPSGSLGLATTIDPLAACTPAAGREFGEIAFPADQPETYRLLNLDRECNYTLNIGFASDNVPTSSGGRANALLGMCQVSALLVFTNGQDIVSSNAEEGQSLRFPSVNNLNVNIGNRTLVQVTLFISDTCPTLSVVFLQFDVIGGLEGNGDIQGVVAGASIIPEITAVQESALRGCFAAPLQGSSAIVGGDLINVPASSTGDIMARDETMDTTETVRPGSLIYNFAVRPAQGAPCRYTVSYPTGRGPLSLYAEAELVTRDMTGAITGNVFERSNADPRVITVPQTSRAADGAVDGMWSRSAAQLQGQTITFTYIQRQLDITVLASFPRDSVFLSSDRVTYSISVIGPCGPFPSILRRVFGGIATTIPLTPIEGDTIVFSPELADFISPTSQSEDLTYRLEPVVVVPGQSQPLNCSVQVEQSEAPTGCTLLGDNPQVLTFREGLDAFSFEFDHDCTGADRIAAGRTVTG